MRRKCGEDARDASPPQSPAPLFGKCRHRRRLQPVAWPVVHLAQALLLLALVGRTWAASANAMFVGRIWPATEEQAELPQLMTWSASSARFAFTGASSVTVLLNGSLGALPQPDRLHHHEMPSFPFTLFQFDLDGEKQGTGSTTSTQPLLQFKLAGLSEGRHTLTVTKLSQAHFGAAWLHSVRLSPGGRFLPPPLSPGQRSGRRMLFVGDSLTVGTGDVGGPKCASYLLNNTGSLRAYGPLTARHYSADAQLIAWGGAGLNLHTAMPRSEWTEERRREAYPTMRDLWTRADALNSGSRYPLGSWVPQVVVMAAGINDFLGYSITGTGQVAPSAFAAPTLQRWADGYEALIREIRTAYQEAAIISMVWPLEVQLAGLHNMAQTAAYLQYMARAFSRLQRQRIQNIYSLQLDGEAFDPKEYCLAHPTAPIHAQVAEQLIEFIDGVLPSFGSSTHNATASGKGAAAAAEGEGNHRRRKSGVMYTM